MPFPKHLQAGQIGPHVCFVLFEMRAFLLARNLSSQQDGLNRISVLPDLNGHSERTADVHQYRASSSTARCCCLQCRWCCRGVQFPLCGLNAKVGLSRVLPFGFTAWGFAGGVDAPPVQPALDWVQNLGPAKQCSRPALPQHLVVRLEG